MSGATVAQDRHNAMGIRPIETRAYGHRFRSRLEARYAIFMTELGVAWQYEPEGFDLDAGHYLPDFYLPKLKTWLEIKPHGSGSYFGFTADSNSLLCDPRLVEFAERAQQNRERFFVAYGLPSTDLFCSWDYASEGMLEAPWDPFMWCICGCGKTADIQFDGRGDRIECSHRDCIKSSHGDKGYSHDHPKIMNAAEAARCARFEHGESPR